MNIMTPGVATMSADIGDIAESTSAACISTRVRQLSRIVTRVYDDALRPLGITVDKLPIRIGALSDAIAVARAKPASSP